MTAPTVATLTVADLANWPPTVSVPKAGEVFGISPWTAYDLARRGEFPVRVLKLGRRRRVSTSELIAYLGGPAEVA